MNSPLNGVVFIVAGLLFIFHDYYAGSSDHQNVKKGKEFQAIDIMMGFFFLGLGAYYLF